MLRFHIKFHSSRILIFDVYSVKEVHESVSNNGRICNIVNTYKSLIFEAQLGVINFELFIQSPPKIIDTTAKNGVVPQAM